MSCGTYEKCGNDFFVFMSFLFENVSEENVCGCGVMMVNVLAARGDVHEHEGTAVRTVWFACRREIGRRSRRA